MAYISGKRKIHEFENAKFTFVDFDGAKSAKNRFGGQKMNVRIFDEEEAQMLYDEGWDVQSYVSKYSNETAYYIPVRIEFYDEDDRRSIFNPEITLITGKKKTPLEDEMDVKRLAKIDIERIDLILTTSSKPKDNLRADGTECYTAHIKEMWVKGYQSKFAEKYADEYYD